MMQDYENFITLCLLRIASEQHKDDREILYFFVQFLGHKDERLNTWVLDRVPARTPCEAVFFAIEFFGLSREDVKGMIKIKAMDEDGTYDKNVTYEDLLNWIKEKKAA